MKHELETLVQDLLEFSIVSFLVITVFCGILYLLVRHQTSSRQKRHRNLLGLLAGFTPVEALSLSLLTIRQIYFIWILFHTKTSIIYLIILVIIGLIYNILNHRFANLFFDLLNCILLYFALFTKNIFHIYLTDISNTWHVVVFYVMLIVFAIIYSLYFYFRNLKVLAASNFSHLSKT